MPKSLNWNGDTMPNKRTRTSLLRRPGTLTVPPICISKPTGIACFLLRYNCDGTFAGVANYGQTTLNDCQFIKNAQTSGYGTMIYNDPPKNVFVTETYDNCAVPPPLNQPFSQATSTLIEDADYYAIWDTIFIGALQVFLDPDTHILTSVSQVQIRYYWQKFSGQYYIYIYLDNNFPTYSYFAEGWPSGYVVAI